MLWFRWVTDFGVSGPDRAQGGRYLIAGPGYGGPLPDPLQDHRHHNQPNPKDERQTCVRPRLVRMFHVIVKKSEPSTVNPKIFSSWLAITVSATPMM